MLEGSQQRLYAISARCSQLLAAPPRFAFFTSKSELHNCRCTTVSLLPTVISRSFSIPGSGSVVPTAHVLKQNEDSLARLMRWARHERKRRPKVNQGEGGTATRQKKSRKALRNIGSRNVNDGEQQNPNGTDKRTPRKRKQHGLSEERMEIITKDRKKWNQDIITTLEMIRNSDPQEHASNGPTVTERTEDPSEKLADRVYSELSFENYPLEAIEVQSEAHIYPPVLEHGIDRVLFNPGVHFLQDPRSRVYNFPPEIRHIMSVHEFDYDALPEYQISSRDKVLQSIAREHNCKYYGSTSSLTAMLSQFHYLISKWRSPHGTHISHYHEEALKFTSAASMAASVFVRYMPETGLYAIDSDKSEDSEIILMWLGRSMELQLVTPTQTYENFRRSKSHLLDPDQRKQREPYHYSKCGDFMLRSQQDCMDPRLPNGGTFDLKTRAVAAARYDIEHIHEVGETGYQLKALHGKYESFESEYRDMIRASFLKYSLQVRIGRMDGILVAYHNIARLFGFQYVPIDELDLCIHGENHKYLAKAEFMASMGILNDFLDRVTTEYPEQSFNLVFHVPQETHQMSIFLKLMTNDEIDVEQAKKRDQGFRLKPTAESIAKQLEEDPDMPNSKVEELVRTIEQCEVELKEEKSVVADMPDRGRIDRTSVGDDHRGSTQLAEDGGVTSADSPSVNEDKGWAANMQEFGIEVGKYTDEVATREFYQIDVRNFISGKELDFAESPEPTAEGQWKLQYSIYHNESPAEKRAAYAASVQSRAKGNREERVTTKTRIMYRELGLKGKQYQNMMDNLDQKKGIEVYSPGRLKEIMSSDEWVKNRHLSTDSIESTKL
ncbi:mitochondrial protein Pet127-domain-containing protein [Lipomyces kononenkoae]